MKFRTTDKAAMPGRPDIASAAGDYMTRQEALAFLGVKQQTLYSYVSRGFIRSISQPDGRTSYYPREDVLKMRAKSAARSGHGAVAASAMHWGEPVIETRITELTNQGPCYRGHLAIDLARQGYSFESVAEFLWGSALVNEPHSWRGLSLPPSFPALLRECAALHHQPHFPQLLASATVVLGIADGSLKDRYRAGSTPVQTARFLIRALVGVFGFLRGEDKYVQLDDEESVAQGLLRTLGLNCGSEQVKALNAALVLVADHELNPATFAARIAASCGADMHACVGAAINTHYSLEIGCACDRVEDIFAISATSDAIIARATKLRAMGRKLPGFDHHLYPGGDPRAHALIEMAKSTAGADTKPIFQALTHLEAEFDTHPSVEGGLVFLCRTLGIARGGASGLYALGRCAGWIAHIMEQRSAGYMIRPRAKFKSGLQ